MQLFLSEVRSSLAPLTHNALVATMTNDEKEKKKKKEKFFLIDIASKVQLASAQTY